MKFKLALSILLCSLLVVSLSSSSVMALGYTDTEFDFQSWAIDTSSLSTLDYGFIQDCEDDLDGADGWTKNSNGICAVDSTNYYEGTKSANISSTSGTNGITKTFDSNNGFGSMVLAVWISGEQNAANEGQGYIQIKTLQNDVTVGRLAYVLANSTYFASEWENGTDWGFSDDGDDKRPRVAEDKPISTQATYWAAIRVGDANATGQYIIRDVQADYTATGSRDFLGVDIIIEIKTSADYKLNVDVFLLGYAVDDLHPLPEFTVTGNAKGYYNETGLCLETGSGESAYAQIDFDNFGDKWDYAIKIIYSGTGTSTNVSSSLNIDEAGWATWNHTIATLGNTTFMYYTTNQSYSGEDIAGRYVNIDCPASSSIIIQSLTIRTGIPTGGGGGNGGGGGGVAPETVVSDVVEELTTPLLFGISYAHLLLIGILGVFIGKKYTKKKFTYRVPKQSHLFVSIFGVFILGFSWLSLSVIYLETPPTEISQLPYEFYLIGLAMPVAMFALARTIKMQNVERPPNKTAFESKDFAPSIVKGIVILTGVSFVLYYMLNFFLGFKADTFLVTNLPTQTTLFAFQLSTATIFFLNVVLPFLEELLFRFVVPQTLAPYMDEFGRAILSAAIFGGFHYYVARILGFAYFIYFFAGGIIFYTVCYGSKWIESRWKRFPQRLRFKGAGIMAAFIVHIIFNLMALYSAFLLTEIWVIPV